MPSAVWVLVGAYLLVAAATLAEAEFRPARSAAPGPVAYCAAALLFAGTWPLRAARGLWHRIKPF
jgi:hypothetical protein